MKLYLAVALLGSVAAFSVPSLNGSSTEQLRYKFVSQVLTGIPDIADQYSGYILSGEFVLQRVSTTVSKFQLQNLKFMNFNGKTVLVENPSLGLDIKSPVEEDVPTDVKNHLETPFRVVFDQRGGIQEIQTESTEPVMITNIKKAIVSNQDWYWMKGSSIVDTNEIKRNTYYNINDDRQPEASFKQMEQTLQGECEILYKVNKLPEYQVKELDEQQQDFSKSCANKNHYQVIKNINFQNCLKRPSYHRSVGTNSKSDGTDGATSPIATEATGSTAIWCGSLEQPIIRQQIHGQRVLVNGNGKFESQEKIDVRSFVRIQLISRENKSELPEIRSVKTTDSLSFTYPSGEFWTSTTSASSQSSNGHYLPQHDMTSAPINPYPTHGNTEEAKQAFVDSFVKMIHVSKHSPESNTRHEDVVNHAAILSLYASSFSYDDINDCWTKCIRKLNNGSLYKKETVLNVFCDILSMASTNPSVKFISEKLMNGQLQGESGAWIAANMIRSVRTPTETVLEELTNLLKDPKVQEQRTLRATVAMTLTELVHKACVDETLSKFNYPTRAYGTFCTEKSKVLRKKLIPFLQSKLTEQSSELRKEQPSSDALNNLVTYINAIGNLGMDEASTSLLDVIDGKITSHSHPRSVAVYKLIRTAARNPTKYRQVIMALIQNTAEHEEVRMAAVSALPYCEPKSSDLQKIAVLTWHDSSRQVSSYISSTLKNLKDLPIGSYEQVHKLSSKASEALMLAKPFDEGLHKSQNIKIQQFIDNLKASVALKLQYVNSEESAFPRNIYLKSEIDSKVQNTKQLESSVYVQGVDKVIEKVQDMYKILFQQQQHEEQVPSKLQFTERKSRNPEAHITLKMFDMQRLFTVDTKFLQELVAELSNEMSHESESNGIKRDFLKIIDVSNHLTIVPTAAGVPLYIKHVTPLVLTSHTSIMMGRHQTIEVKSKPVMNYMQQTSVGSFCPLTKQWFGSGVEHSLHATIPLRAYINYKDGSAVSVTLKTPEDFESQKYKPVFEHRVNPYTIKTELYTPVETQKKQIKTIYAEDQLIKKDYQIGKALGIDLRASVESDSKHIDIATLVQELYQHQPLTLFSLPIPFKSCRAYRSSLHYSPSTSSTKEASFVFSFGQGQKLDKNELPKVQYPWYLMDESIKSECTNEVREGRWESQEQVQQEVQEKRYRMEWGQQIQQTQQVGEHQQMDHKHWRCISEKSCLAHKQNCVQELKKEHRPYYEIERICEVRVEECKLKFNTKLSTKNVLFRMETGSATTVGGALIFKTNQDKTKKIDVQVSFGSSFDSQKQPKKSEVDVKITYQPEEETKPYEFILRSSVMADRPLSKWNKESILSQELKGELFVQTYFGRQSDEQKVASFKVTSGQTVEQKKFAMESSVAKKCDQQISYGKLLTRECKIARAAAGSLDRHVVKVNVPSMVTENVYLRTIAEVCEAAFAPYIKYNNDEFNKWRMSQGLNEQREFSLNVQVHPEGKKFSMLLTSESGEVEFNEVRMPSLLQGLLPLNIKNSQTTNLIQKLTSHKAPSTCAIERETVRTFDNVEYQYPLKNCEHVIFKDCSESSRIEVTSKSTSSSRIVKAIIDGQKYEVEIPQSGKPTVRVNGQKKTYVSGHVDRQSQSQNFVAQEYNYYNDKNTYISSYQDGVMVIKSNMYGLSIYCNFDRIEVKSYQHILRNRACGLCGDLNGEKYADVKSSYECIMSSPKLAAYSYMIQDSTCEGIPSQDLQLYKQETQQCVKKENMITQVNKVFGLKVPIFKKHLVQEKENKICISKEQVNVCPSSSNPREVEHKKVQYFCVSKDAEGTKMKKMAEMGDLISQAKFLPSSFEREVSQPSRC